MSLVVKFTKKMSGVYQINPEGSLDSNTYRILEERVDAVITEKPDTIVFNMASLDYISSLGIRVIAKTQKTMRAAGGRVVLLHLQPQIQKVFDIIKAMPSEQIFSSMQELDDYLDRMQKKVREK